MSLTIKSLGTIKQAGGVLNRVGEAIDDLLKGHNNIAKPLGVNLDGSAVIPAQVSQFTAQHLGNGIVDLAIVDKSTIVRAIEYHVEYALAGPGGAPDFTNPRGMSLGPWRNGTITLPNGSWYFRAYSQYPAGGPPSAPVISQGPIQISSSVTATLSPSQSSGTGVSHTGGGEGSGKAISR